MDRAVLFLLILAVALRLPWMFQSLWYDEISATQYYLKNIFHLLDASFYQSNMPVHFVLMFFWDKLFKDTEFSVRFLPLIFGLASLPLAYEVAKRTFDQKVALLTCFLLAISPVHIWYSTEARPYAGMMFFLLLALLAFQKLMDPVPRSSKNHTTWLVTYFVSLFLGTFSHLYMLIPLLVFSGISLFQKGRSRFIFLLLNGIILFVLACFLWFKHIVGGIPSGALYLRQFTPGEAWRLFFNWYTTGNTMWPAEAGIFSWRELLNHPLILFCQVFFFLAFLKGIVSFWKEADNNKKFWGYVVLGFLFSIPIFLFIANAAGFRSTYVERSAYVGLPFFFMILARGVVESKTLLSISLLIGLVIFSGLGTLGLFQKTNPCPVGPCKPDWKSAARYLAKDIGRSKEKAAVISSLAPRSLTYYDTSFADRVRLLRLQEFLPRMSALVKKTLGVESGVFKAFQQEIQDVKNQLKMVNKDKTTVLNFRGIDKGNLPYQTLYAFENPYNIKRSKPFRRLLQNNPDFKFSGKETFHALSIYKFEHR